MKIDKKFVYLIQGQASLVKNFFYLTSQEYSDAIFLTYDKEIDQAIFYPDSTWAEGRNLLLQKALEKGKYLYYIFLDDDLKFISGDFNLFEKQILEYKPAIAYPVFYPNSIHTIFGIGISAKSKFFVPFSKKQLCRFGDAQLMAFHRDVINDGLIFPLQVQFDKISWWCTSSTQQLLVFNLYDNYTLQFNNIRVINEGHGEYTKNSYKKIQYDWFRSQFRKPIVDPRKKIINLFSVAGAVRLLRRVFSNPRNGIDTIKESISTLFKSMQYKGRSDYSYSREKLESILKPSSDLYKQYMRMKDNPDTDTG